MTVQNNRPESSPNAPEETSSLERGDELSSPTSTGDVQESGTAGPVESGGTPGPARGDATSARAVESPRDGGNPAGIAPNVAPEAEEAALAEREKAHGEQGPGEGMTADAGTAAPAEPSGLAAPTESTAPTESIGSTEPTDPAQPTASTGPTASAEPTESAESADHAEDGSSLERDDEEVIYVRRSAVRRRPKYGRFIGLGALMGAVLAFLIAQAGEVVGGGEGIGYSRTDLVLVLAITLVPLGALVGGVVAMLFDRSNRKRQPPDRQA